MTANQLAYWKNVETERHNKAIEAEDHRSNVASETEKTRAAQAQEAINQGYLDEEKKLTGSKKFQNVASGIGTAARGVGSLVSSVGSLFSPVKVGTDTVETVIESVTYPFNAEKDYTRETKRSSSQNNRNNNKGGRN